MAQHSMRTQPREIVNLLRAQCLIGATLVALVMPFGFPPVVSVGLGSAACLLATALGALWVFRPYRAQVPRTLIARFHAALVIKIAVIAAVFVTAKLTWDAFLLPIGFAGYLFVQTFSAMMAHSRPHSRPSSPLKT